MRELSLHLLDIAENSIAALARTITVAIQEDTQADRLSMSVRDDGKGMDADLVARVIDPFVTSRTTRKVGLGIPLLKAAAEACNGGLTIQSKPGEGTLLQVDMQRSHIDRMPLGDLPGTLLTLLVGNPHIHWIITYRVNDDEFTLDDQAIKQELEGVPLSDPLVISFLRELLENGIGSIQPQPVY